MPMPNRLPYLVDEAVAGLTLAQMIERRAVIIVQCHGCWHEAVWGAGELHRKFPGRRHLTVEQVAARLRCSRCRSEWLQVVQLHGARATAHNTRLAR